MNTINLLPGWSLAASNLAALQQALQGSLPDYNLISHELPPMQMSNLEADLEQLASSLLPGWLVGWSLGGVLAVQLLRRYPERFCGVVTIASNACFAARADWPEAMPADTFKAFFSEARQNPEKIRKRFALLVTQGAAQPRELSRQLKWTDADPLQRLNHLALLGVLDNRAHLRRCEQPVLHVLAAQDVLVPAAVAAELQALNDQAKVAVHPQCSHALPLEQPQWLAQQIADWVQQA
ncbi:alpha/beta fold hydrolase [Halopseudomonas sabulinigri]|uniref:Alpha/beta fold hydrolase n=1 Tax=Halopseudomonas sabulinigri TaxID=472181 RepID=A0ABP9ZU04_9GAMM